MEFPHELKELFPNEIIEVRGNADALTVILKHEVDVNAFTKILEKKFTDLDDTYILFLRKEDEHDFIELVLK